MIYRYIWHVAKMVMLNKFMQKMLILNITLINMVMLLMWIIHVSSQGATDMHTTDCAHTNLWLLFYSSTAINATNNFKQNMQTKLRNYYQLNHCNCCNWMHKGSMQCYTVVAVLEFNREEDGSVRRQWVWIKLIKIEIAMQGHGSPLVFM